jgi:hypothetical protein
LAELGAEGVNLALVLTGLETDEGWWRGDGWMRASGRKDVCWLGDKCRNVGVLSNRVIFSHR